MNNERNQGLDMTEGLIWKQLLLFFFPILLGTFFQQLYNTVDAIIVGRFVGTDALAAVGGSAARLQQLVLGVFNGTATGAAVVISQYVGRKDKKGVDAGIHTIYAFSVIGGAVILAAGEILTPLLLEWMGTPSQLMPDSIAYLRIYFSGMIFVFVYNAGSAILRSLGDSRRPLYYLIFCALVNTALDLAFVVGAQMGIAGAALATVIAQGLSCLLVTWALARDAGLELKRIRINRYMLRRELSIGIPDGIQYAMYDLPNIIIQVAVNSFGTVTLAAWSAYGKIDAVYWMLSSSVGATTATFVGQNFGAGRLKRATKGIYICAVIDAVFSLLVSVVIYFFGAPLLGIFTEDRDVIAVGVDMMKVVAPWYGLYLFVEVFSGALRGISCVIVPLILTVLGVCVLRSAWVLIGMRVAPTLAMICWDYPVTWGATAIMFIIYFIYKWRAVQKQA